MARNRTAHPPVAPTPPTFARPCARLALGLLSLALCSAGCDTLGGRCRSSGDCRAGQDCLGPNAPPTCGIPPQQQCSSDGDCAGERCSVVFDACSPDGIGSQCRPACTSDAGCGQGLRCNAGACEAVPCDEGYSCPAHQICNPSVITPQTPVFDRHHGCVDVACSSDGECPVLSTCVNGRCQTGPGRCVVPMAVP